MIVLDVNGDLHNFQELVAKLKYGSISVNGSTFSSFMFRGLWGAFPGSQTLE
jgi:hypothetical protein